MGHIRQHFLPFFSTLRAMIPGEKSFVQIPCPPPHPHPLPSTPPPHLLRFWLWAWQVGMWDYYSFALLNNFVFWQLIISRMFSQFTTTISKFSNCLRRKYTNPKIFNIKEKEVKIILPKTTYIWLKWGDKLVWPTNPCY